MAAIAHVLYRRRTTVSFDDFRETVVSVLYALSMTILTAACLMEWYCHCDINSVPSIQAKRSSIAACLSWRRSRCCS
jgi:anaerobic C4-dicarboxylate transporter